MLPSKDNSMDGESTECIKVVPIYETNQTNQINQISQINRRDSYKLVRTVTKSEIKQVKDLKVPFQFCENCQHNRDKLYKFLYDIYLELKKLFKEYEVRSILNTNFMTNDEEVYKCINRDPQEFILVIKNLINIFFRKRNVEALSIAEKNKKKRAKAEDPIVMIYELQATINELLKTNDTKDINLHSVNRNIKDQFKALELKVEFYTNAYQVSFYGNKLHRSIFGV